MAGITARFWREAPKRYRGEAGRSKATGKVFFPSRLIEPGNHNREFDPVKLNYDGTLLTYTVIRVAPRGFERISPYALGIVELDDGGRITSQIADVSLDKIQIGMRMRVEFRKVADDSSEGIHLYGYKVVPA